MRVDSAIILKNKQSKILMALKDTSQNWYISTLAKAAGSTYVHACNFLKECETLGVVQSERHGKIKVVKLTEKGAKIVESLANIVNLMNQTQPPSVAPPAEQKPVQPQ